MAQASSPNYRPTSLYRTLVANKVLSPTTKHEDIRYVPNNHPAADTWDARHLDKFLAGSNFTQSPSRSTKNHSVSLPSDNPFKDFGENSLSKGKVRGYGSPDMKESFFIKNGPRDAKIHMKEYLHKVYKDFGFRDPSDNINTMSLISGTDSKTRETFHMKNVPQVESSFDQKNLEYARQIPEKLLSPAQRKKELDEVRGRQGDFSNWNEKIRGFTKKKVIYKNSYKSGILGVDNPLLEDTKFYTEEAERLTTIEGILKAKSQDRFKELEKWTNTNGSMEFCNRNFNREENSPPKRMVDYNIRKKVQLPHVESWKDSRTRLFGDMNEKNSEMRRKYLIEMERRGRTWNVVTAHLENKKQHTGLDNPILHTHY